MSNLIFFFKQKTAYEMRISDWSSDVCSSDLRLAVTLTPIEPVSWTMVLEQVAQGKIDLLPGIMSTPERQSYLAFTRPYLDFPIVILAHHGGAEPHNLEALYGLKIAVVENYAPHALLRNHHQIGRAHV